MKKLNCICSLIVMLFFSLAISYGQSSIMPVTEVKAGMKGEGYTVLKGTQVESFPVEVIGVLKNSLGPKMDMILIRLLGDKAEQYGVVAGMSGSPIYIDGKLAGALAYRLGFFAREAMAGVTPIEYMLRLEGKGSGSGVNPLAIAWYKELKPPYPLDALEINKVEEPQKLNIAPYLDGHIFKPIETPLGFSGFHPAVIEGFSNRFNQFGLVAFQSGVSNGDTDKAPLEPGSSIAVQLMKGDIALSASGTVTYVDRNKVLAFGHPFLQMGHIQMPMVKAKVLDIFPGISASFKITSSYSEIIGTIMQDRLSGIFGNLGRKPRLIPIEIKVRSDNKVVENFKFEMISDRLLSPLLLNISVLNAIYSLERVVGDSTIQVLGKVKISKKPEITISNIFTGDKATDNLALYLASILYYLKDNPYQDIDVDSINLSIDYFNSRNRATIERAWFSKDEVRRGDNLTLFVLVKPYRGKSILKSLDLRIPPSLRPGKVNVLVADSITINQHEKILFQGKFKPKDLNQMIGLINSIRSNNKIYVDFWRPDASLVVNGQYMPALPPSLLSIFNDKQTPGSFIRLNYNLLDEQKITTKYFISGNKKLSIIVKE